MRIDIKTAAQKLGVSPALFLRHANTWGIMLIPKNPASKRMTYVVEEHLVDELMQRQTSKQQPVQRFEV